MLLNTNMWDPLNEDGLKGEQQKGLQQRQLGKLTTLSIKTQL